MWRSLSLRNRLSLIFGSLLALWLIIDVSRILVEASARAAANAIQAAVEALQNQNRRILADLRPAALEEFGLTEALRALIAHWRRAEPDVDLVLDIDQRAEALSERAATMAYRFVQEALTNAYRHAGGTRIEVSLTFEETDMDASLRDPALPGLVLRVADNGRGLQSESRAGMGLAGMRDRVRMLGGRIALFPRAEGGTVVEARFAGSLGKTPDEFKN